MEEQKDIEIGNPANNDDNKIEKVKEDKTTTPTSLNAIEDDAFTFSLADVETIESLSALDGNTINLQVLKENKFKAQWIYKSLNEYHINLSVTDYMNFLQKQDLTRSKEDLLQTLIDDQSKLSLDNTTNNNNTSIHDEIKIEINGNTIEPEVKIEVVGGAIPTYSCPICFQDVTSTQIVSYLECKHAVCELCLNQYLIQKIKQGEVGEMLCPFVGCKEVFSNQILEGFLFPEWYTKFVRYQKAYEITKDANLIWCPKPGCEKYVNKSTLPETAVEKKLKCNCGQEVCVECREAWHPGLICEEAIDPEFKKMLKSVKMDVKRCPNCATRIFRDGGCPHMLCKVCSYEFCWNCMQKFTGDHMLSNSENRCKKFSWTSEIRRTMFRNFLDVPLAIGAIILFVILKCLECLVMIIGTILSPFLFTLMLMAWGGITMLSWVYGRDPYKLLGEKGTCKETATLIGVFTLGFVISPLIYLAVLLIKIFSCMLCCLCAGEEFSETSCVGRLNNLVQLSFPCPPLD
jgi:hypothetical protein